MGDLIDDLEGHSVTLQYTTRDDGIHMDCSCGISISLGFSPSIKEAAIAYHDHARTVIEAGAKEKKNKKPMPPPPEKQHIMPLAEQDA